MSFRTLRVIGRLDWVEVLGHAAAGFATVRIAYLLTSAEGAPLAPMLHGLAVLGSFGLVH